MATKLQWSKSGLRLNFDVSAQPTPRIQQAYPFPDIPIQEAQLLGVALETIAQTSRSGIRVRSLGTAELPGTAGAVFSLNHVTVQGAITVEEEIAVPGRTINLLVEQAIPGALHSFALKRTDAGQVTVWPAVSINTPADPTLENITALQAAVASLGSDGVLTVGEKASAITTYSGLLSQVTTLRSQCTTVGGTAPAQNTLLPYLQSLGPWPWNDVQPGHNTTIPVPATWTAKWGEIYTEIGALTSAIAAKLSSDTGTKLPASGTAANSLLLAGYAPDTAGSPNTIVRRDSAGGITGASGTFSVSDNLVAMRMKAAAQTLRFLPFVGGVGSLIQAINPAETIPAALMISSSGVTFDAGITATTGAFGGAVTGTELIAANYSTIARVSIYSNSTSSLYSYVNGQPRTVLATDGTNWSIGTWTAAGAWNDNPIIIPIAGGAISFNRGATFSGNVTLNHSGAWGYVFANTSENVMALSTASKGFYAGTSSFFVNDATDSVRLATIDSPTGNMTLRGGLAATSGNFSSTVYTTGTGFYTSQANYFGNASWLVSGYSDAYAAVRGNAGVVFGAGAACVGFFTASSNGMNGMNPVSGRTQWGSALIRCAASNTVAPLSSWDAPGIVRLSDQSYHADLPSAGGGGYGNMLNLCGGSDTMSQIYCNYDAPRMFLRTGNFASGAWQWRTGATANGWVEVFHSGNIDTAPASLQALKSLVTAPQVGPLSSRPAASSYPKGYYYATDATAPDGLLGALYYSDGSTWSAALNPQTIAGRVIAGTLSAGSGGFTAIAAYMAMTGTLQSLPYTAGAAGVVPSGFRFSGNVFLSTFYDGSQAYVQGEIGGNMNMVGYKVDGLALAKISGGGFVEWTAPGTYTWVCPRNITEITLTLVGAGASGDANNTGNYGGGGGGALKVKVPVTPFQAYSVVVGAGGIPVVNAAGRDGADSTGLGYTARGGKSKGPSGGITGPAGTLAGLAAGASAVAKIGLRYVYACPGGGGGSPTVSIPSGSTDFYSGGTNQGGGGGGGASAAGAGGNAALNGTADVTPGSGYGAGGGAVAYAGWASGAGAPGYARIDY